MNIIQPRWFVQNANDPDEAREPGLLKIEQHIQLGSVVALRMALNLVRCEKFSMDFIRF